MIRVRGKIRGKGAKENHWPRRGAGGGQGIDRGVEEAKG
jgi:hypothetical protein